MKDKPAQVLLKITEPKVRFASIPQRPEFTVEMNPPQTPCWTKRSKSDCAIQGGRLLPVLLSYSAFLNEWLRTYSRFDFPCSQTHQRIPRSGVKELICILALSAPAGGRAEPLLISAITAPGRMRMLRRLGVITQTEGWTPRASWMFPPFLCHLYSQAVDGEAALIALK